MRNRISKTELSAYLDGEARDARRVEAALEASSDLRRERDALARMSGMLQSLEEPEPRVGFAGRVIAHLNDAQPQPARARLRPALSFGAIAVAAMVALVIGLGTQPADRAIGPDGDSVALEPDDVAVEAELMAELERYIASDEGIQRVITARFDTAPQPEELYSDRLLAAVAQYDDVAYAGGASGFVRDYRPALRSLDAVQTDALKEILAQSVAEGLEG